MPGRQLSRRGVLVGAGLLVAGCHARAQAKKPPAPGAVNTALAEAVVLEVRVSRACADALRNARGNEHARLQVQNAAHDVHLAALTALVEDQGGTPAATPSSSTSAGPARPGAAGRVAQAHSLTELHHRLRTSVSRLRRLAVAEPNGKFAAVYAAIAASHDVLGSRT